jgi:hypothetical protein
MAQIREVVLFYSEFSDECRQCLGMINQYRFPVSMIQLDDPQSRKAAMTGKVIQIKNVPSLLLIHVDDTQSLYVGSPKILAWFRHILEENQKNQNPPEQHREPQEFQQPLQRYTEGQDRVQNSPQKNVKSKKPNKKPKKKGNQKSSSVELIFEGHENTHSTTVKPMGKNKNMNKGLGASFGSDKTSPNSDLMAMAKRMEAEREHTLGQKAVDNMRTYGDDY